MLDEQEIVSRLDYPLVELAAEEQTRFAEALLNPPPIAAALKRAIANHDQLFEAHDDATVIQRRRREELRAEMKIGIDQLDRGEGELLNMDEILNEARRRIGSVS